MTHLPTADRQLGAPASTGVAVVSAGGDGIDDRALARLPAPSMVIAADSGLDAAVANGIGVDLVVGDLDSVSPTALAAAERAGMVIERHPADKDATDLDLALRRVADGGFPICYVLGGGGGRLSHLLANAQLVAAERHRGIDVRWLVGDAEVRVARPDRPVIIEGSRGDLASLLPSAAAATGITTVGLRWALHGATLEPGSSHGVSNELTASQAMVSVGSGTLLVIHEGGGT